MDAENLLKILQDAQLAHEAGDFVRALEFYARFFDHSFSDPALYGVRLTHGLDGWQRLAQDFPGARNGLQDKADECQARYLQHQEPERFHDYLQICERLGQADSAVQLFLDQFRSAPEQAIKLSRYVWQPLVAAQEWTICNALLQEPSLKLDELFALYDERIRMRDVNPAFASVEFEQHSVDELMSGLQELITVLRFGQRTEATGAIERQFLQGVQTRNHATLSKVVNAQGALIFGGH